jgi:hypothetical protein
MSRCFEEIIVSNFRDEEYAKQETNGRKRQADFLRHRNPKFPQTTPRKLQIQKDETDVGIKSWEDTLEFEICFQTSRRKQLN